MKIRVDDRQPGTAPYGLIFMLPLFALPLGAWAVQTRWIVFGTCGLKELVGLPCLTCGATRATLHLLHGNPLSAIAMQPLIVTLYGALVVWGLVSGIAYLTNRAVRVDLTDWQLTALKISLLVGPLLNWGYLIAAGI